MSRPELDAELKEFLRGRDVFISMSGGSDSTALGVMFGDYMRSERLFRELTIVHFEHGFRGKASLNDEQFCREFALKNDISFISYHLDVPSNILNSEGDEEAARRLRFEKWHDLIGSNDNAVIALGHNSSDRVENFFLRAARGSNASGLTSMRRIQRMGNLVLVRPLLDFSKDEIEDYLRSSDIEKWCFDSTNAENLYNRNFLRNEILPRISEKIPFSASGFESSLNVLELDADFLETEALKAFETIPQTQWLTLHKAILVRVMRLFISDAIGKTFIPDANFMKRLADAASIQKDSLIPLQGQHDNFLRISKKGFSIEESLSETPEKIDWDFRNQNECTFGNARLEVSFTTKDNLHTFDHQNAYFDANQLPDILTISTFEQGDTMIPFASSSPKKLKKIFTDEGISRFERTNFPILRTPKNEIIWIAGLRQAEFARINAQSDEIAIFKIFV